MTTPELVDALKKRKLYQPEAAALLVRMAILRGIIRTEEDLDSPEFTDSGSGFTLFPCSENEVSRDKLFRSLIRSLMVAGVIPIAFGIFKFTLQKYVEGAGMISLGIIWMAAAWFIMEKREMKLLYPMLALVLLSLMYVIRILMLFDTLRWSDIMVTSVLYLALFYLIFYTRSILNRVKSSKGKLE
jgi:hypothetical protein